MSENDEKFDRARGVEGLVTSSTRATWKAYLIPGAQRSWAERVIRRSTMRCPGWISTTKARPIGQGGMKEVFCGGARTRGAGQATCLTDE